MARLRKPIQLTDEQQTKIRRLAAIWGCSEAKVLRGAIDRLPDPDYLETGSDLDRAVKARLSAAGLLVAPPATDDVPTDPAEIETLEQEYEAWVDSLPEPLGLTEAVLEERGVLEDRRLATAAAGEGLSVELIQ
jgi:hypothetical protein